MLTNYQRSVQSKLSDSRPGSASKVGTLNGTKTFQDSVDVTEQIILLSHICVTSLTSLNSRSSKTAL